MVVRMILGIALAVALGALALIAPARGYSSDMKELRALTPQQAGVVAQKNSALAARAGVDSHAGPPAALAGPDTPVTPILATIRFSKAEALGMWTEGWAKAQTYIAEIERNVGPAAAQAIRDDFARQRRNIDAIPDGEQTRELPAVHAGRGSIQFTQHTYQSDGVTRVDPISVVFYGLGSANNVAWWMQNQTTLLWGTSCGGPQWIYTWDAMHGGTDGWNDQDYDLERESGACGVPRYHARLFDRYIRDTHNEFEFWSISSPHHDNLGHGCADDFENSQQKVHDSFVNGSGAPLYFVGTLWTANFGNAGTYGSCGAYNDGTGWYISIVN